MQNVKNLPTAQGAPSQANGLDLKDIHIPEQVSNYPIAYGWWLLAALVIVITIYIIIKNRKATKRNLVKKQALLQLKNTTDMSVSETVAILKWAAMHYFSRADLAKLFGQPLQRFLTSKLPNSHQSNFNSLSEQAFLNQYIDKNDSIDYEQQNTNFNKAAILWLTHAVPPKPAKNLNNNTSSQGAGS